MNIRVKYGLSVALVAGLLLSCSSSDEIDVTSSWLGPLHNYERVSGKENDGVFVRKEAKPVAAERILLMPAEITVSVESDLNSVTPRAYERIRQAFADALARELSKQPNNTADGAATYIVRIALTNLTVKRIGKEIGAASLADLRFSFETAAIEAELRNRLTNRRNAAVVLPATAKTATAGDLPAIFERFAQRVSAHIAEARAELTRRSRAPAAPAPATKK